MSDREKRSKWVPAHRCFPSGLRVPAAGRAAPGGFAEMVEDGPGLQHSLGEVGTGVSSPHHVFISKDLLAATLWPQFSSHLCISDFLNKVQNKL